MKNCNTTGDSGIKLRITYGVKLYNVIINLLTEEEQEEVRGYNSCDLYKVEKLWQYLQERLSDEWDRVQEFMKPGAEARTEFNKKYVHKKVFLLQWDRVQELAKPGVEARNQFVEAFVRKDLFALEQFVVKKKNKTAGKKKRRSHVSYVRLISTKKYLLIGWIR